MASRHYDMVQALTKRYTIIAGSFAPQGAGTPTLVSGSGFSVTYSGTTGILTVTTQDNYPGINDFSTDLMAAAGGGTWAGPISASPTTGVFKIGTYNASNVLTNMTLTVPDVVYFSLGLRNSSIVS